MKIENAEDIAKLLRVSLDVPTRVYAGNRFTVALEVRLADEHKNESDKLLEIVNAHKDWSGFVDIHRGPNKKTTDISGYFKYSEQSQIFKGGVYRLEKEIKAPRDKRYLNIEGRIRSEYGYNNSPWKAPFIDTKKIKILELY